MKAAVSTRAYRGLVRPVWSDRLQTYVAPATCGQEGCGSENVKRGAGGVWCADHFPAVVGGWAEGEAPMLTLAIVASVLLAAGIGGAVGYFVGHGRGMQHGMATDRRRIVSILDDLRDRALAESAEIGDELAARRNRARGQGSFGPGGAA